MSSRYRIGSIGFEDGGVIFQFVDEGGVRKDGALQLAQSLFVGAHPDYSDELDDLRSKAQEVLRDALEDYATADVVDLDEEEGSDDDEGMGFG